ncbi:MAG: ankyrin repeat domain-containing protein [Sphaerochaetaceae bacterium]|nr:ankyrin repeat domain-containing protein [Sphaerochaetaceae bacterium]
MKKLVVLVVLLFLGSLYASDLFMLMHCGDIHKVAQAIDAGADVHAKNEDGLSVFWEAMGIAANDPYGYEVLELLLTAGIIIDDEICYDEYYAGGISPLAAAVMLEFEEYEGSHGYPLSTWLVKNGADVDVRGEEGIPIFLFPIASNSPKFLTLLIQTGARVNARFENGMNALSFILDEAIASEINIELLEMLIDAGINIDAKDMYGKTPLMYAAENDSLEVIALLLRAGADVIARDNDGETAFEYAQYNDDVYSSKEFWQLCDAHYEGLEKRREQ